MPRKRQHWMDALADDIRDRARDASVAVAETFKDVVPVGYKPPQVQADEVDAFLGLSGSERKDLYLNMGPEEYRQYTTHMMTALHQRFGPAAQALMPLLQAAPLQAQAEGEVSEDADPATAAAAELSAFFGVDVFGR